jgi:hypothetical protein
LSSGITGGEPPVPGEAVRAPENPALIPAQVCAALCAVLNRIPYGGLFFLAPLGVAAFAWGRKTAWTAGLLAMAGGALMAFVFRDSGSAEGVWTGILYFTLAAALFVWIVAPPAPEKPGRFPLPDTPGRIVLAAGLWAAAMGGILLGGGEESPLRVLLRAQGEFISSLYAAAQGGNAVEQEMAEHYLSPDAVAELIMGVTLRGGALVSCVLLFVFNLESAALVNFFIRRVRPSLNLADFHAPRWLIWVLSLSLAGIVLSRGLGVDAADIAAWNVLAACAVLYLAQGIGITASFLARRVLAPGLRMGIHILIIVMVFSPGINVVLLGAVVVLGIAENWAPLRVSPDRDRPSSTPGNGD